jgi:light-harvesting complex 1 beta chain
MHSSDKTLPQVRSVHEGRAFWPIFACSFAMFLAVALVAQILGWQWRSWLPGAEGVKSVTGGVKAAVYTFMSYLQ